MLERKRSYVHTSEYIRLKKTFIYNEDNLIINVV